MLIYSVVQNVKAKEGYFGEKPAMNDTTTTTCHMNLNYKCCFWQHKKVKLYVVFKKEQVNEGCCRLFTNTADVLLLLLLDNSHYPMGPDVYC
jgi:hypothetical protein